MANNVRCLIFIIFLTSNPIINKIHRPSSEALLYSICCLLNDMYVCESFSISSLFGSQLSQEC